MEVGEPRSNSCPRAISTQPSPSSPSPRWDVSLVSEEASVCKNQAQKSRAMLLWPRTPSRQDKGCGIAQAIPASAFHEHFQKLPFIFSPCFLSFECAIRPGLCHQIHPRMLQSSKLISLTTLTFYVSMVHVCTHMYMQPKEASRRHQVRCSILHYLTPLRQGLSPECRTRLEAILLSPATAPHTHTPLTLCLGYDLSRWLTSSCLSFQQDAASECRLSHLRRKHFYQPTHLCSSESHIFF